MRSLALQPLAARPQLLLAGGFSALAATGLWTVVLVDRWPALMAGDSLCGEGLTLLGHCAACWPALAATTMAALFAGTAAIARK